MYPQYPEIQVTQCPVILLQDSSIQVTGHTESQLRPQYPSTHPWIQNPNASQSRLMQFLLHPSFEINIYFNTVVGTGKKPNSNRSSIQHNKPVKYITKIIIDLLIHAGLPKLNCADFRSKKLMIY